MLLICQQYTGDSLGDTLMSRGFGDPNKVLKRTVLIETSADAEAS